MKAETANPIGLSMRRVLSFAMITAAGFVLGKFSGIAREMVVAGQFGLSSDLDAYFLAGSIPSTINNIIAGSAITAAVMPTFARYLAGGKRDEFWEAASIITNTLLVVTGVVTLLAMLFAGPLTSLIAGAGTPETQSMAAQMLVIMMPTLVLGAALNMLMAMLNSLDRFAAPALIFIALNLGIIVTVVLLSPYIGIYAVAWGFLIGVGLQLALQVAELLRERPHYVWRIDLHHPALRPTLIALVPISALAITSQVNLLVDRAMAASLPEGSVGALVYADVILGAFYMVGYSLGIAVFPNLSRLAVENDVDNFTRAVETSLRLLIYVLAPLTGVLIVFAVPIIGTIFGRGRFDAADVSLTAQALVMYAIGLIAVAVLQVLHRAFYAFSDSRTPFVVGGIAVVGHVLLNLLLMPYWGHAGIALSTSLTTIAAVVALTVLMRRHVPRLPVSRLAGFSLQCLGIALVSTIAVSIVYAQLPLTGIAAYLAGVVLAGAGGMLYLLLAHLARTPESGMLFRVVSSYLPRLR